MSLWNHLLNIVTVTALLVMVVMLARPVRMARAGVPARKPNWPLAMVSVIVALCGVAYLVGSVLPFVVSLFAFGG